MPRKPNPRPIRIEGDVAYVPLTKGYEAIIDAADVPLVEGRCWQALVRSRTVYAVRDARTLMHRVILDLPDGFECDHRNNNGIDNRRSNLRAATRSQNQWNTRLSKRSTTGMKGVKKWRKRWVAHIGADGQRLYLGIFKCPTAAHFAYVKASVRLHGEFGRVA